MADNIVDIDGFRLRRTHWTEETKECKHTNVTLHAQGEYITCDDCGKELTLWWVLNAFMSYYDTASRRVTDREWEAKQIEEKQLHLKAAQKVEWAWRRKNSAPSCPHCHRGILPSDGFGGSAVSKEMELRRREIEKEALRREWASKHDSSKGKTDD